MASATYLLVLSLVPIFVAASPISTAERNYEAVYTYDGQLIDVDSVWNDELYNPKSEKFDGQKSRFENHLFTALTDLATLSPQSTVTSFKPKPLNGTLTAVGVSFILGIPKHGVDKAPNASQVEKHIREFAHKNQFNWQHLIIASNQKPLVPPKIGTSYGYKLASSMFLESINASADPCQDFFSYVCDGFNAKNPLGDGTRVGVNENLQADVLTNLTRALKRLQYTAHAHTSTGVGAAYNIFASCAHAKTDDYRGARAILNITREYGGWPILDVSSSWSPSKLPVDIYYTIGNIYGVHGVPTLFSPSVNVDWLNVAGNNLLYLDQAVLAMPAVYYRSPNFTHETKENLRRRINSTVHALAERMEKGEKLNEDKIKKDIDAMVEIEYELALSSLPDSEQRNASLTYESYTVERAEREFPEFNWSSFFRGLLAANETGDEPSTQQFDHRFIITQSRFYAPKLNALLRKYNEDATKLKDLVNYIIFRLITPYMVFAGPEIARNAHQHPIRNGGRAKTEATFDYLSSVALPKNPHAANDDITDQEVQCANFIMGMLPYITGRLYVDDSFPPVARDNVRLMTGNVLAAFRGMLAGLTWMDDSSKLNAYNKIDNMIKNVAYPDFQQQNAELNKYYADVIKLAKEIDPKQYEAFFAYVKVLVAYQTRSMFRQVMTIGDRYDFLMSPVVVNDWYQPERNSITFPAAQLAPPFYSYDFPQAVNYGAFGATVGHELTHGFDDEGVQYDANGTLHTWMSEYSQLGFKQMAQCVVDEYSGFCYPKSKACISGVDTQGENIADNGGLKAAYQAYKAWTFSNGEEPRLPDFPLFTADQIFFIAYGYSWCGAFSDEFLTRLLLTNPHSPYPARVNGVVMNFPEFGRAFGCSKGDDLYPEKYCNVW